MSLLVALTLWVVPIFVAIAQGRSKHRRGWAYGLFLGWLGVIILALLPPYRADMYGECPHCCEDIRLEASVCPHCRGHVTPHIGREVIS